MTYFATKEEKARYEVMDPENDDASDGGLAFDEELGPGYFVIMPSAFLRSDKYSIEAKVLYGILLSYSASGSTAYPGRERLMKEIPASKLIFYKAIKELQDAGIVNVMRRGQGRTNLYYIRKFPTIRKPDVSNPGHQEIPVPGNQDVLNPGHLVGNNPGHLNVSKAGHKLYTGETDSGEVYTESPSLVLPSEERDGEVHVRRTPIRKDKTLAVPKTISDLSPESLSALHTFLSIHPKNGRADAEKAWVKLNPDADTIRLVLSGQDAYLKAYRKKNGADDSFIQLPATFLNKATYLDHQPGEAAPTQQAAATKTPAVLPMPTRQEIPFPPKSLEKELDNAAYMAMDRVGRQADPAAVRDERRRLWRIEYEANPERYKDLVIPPTGGLK